MTRTRSPRRWRTAGGAALALALAAVQAAAGPAAASALDDAKRAGRIGERFDGYVGAVAANPTPETQGLVAEINAERKREYGEVAARNGVPIEAVAQISGKKLVERAPAGSWVMLPDGRWRQK